MKGRKEVIKMAEYKWSMEKKEGKHCPFCFSGLFKMTPLNQEAEEMFRTWDYYCRRCQNLVVPVEDMSKEPLPEGAIGRVVAIPLKISITES